MKVPLIIFGYVPTTKKKIRFITTYIDKNKKESSLEKKFEITRKDGVDNKGNVRNVDSGKTKLR